jgi:hypothetical protein
MCSFIGVNNMLKVVFIFQGKYGKKRGGAAGRGKSNGGFNKWKYKKGGNESSKKKSAASATPSHGGSANRSGGSSSRGRGTAMPGMMPVPVPYGKNSTKTIIFGVCRSFGKKRNNKRTLV